ncbi:unnamed protein product [Caenorhabditis sp. 36 PRJEB53466]|nr:unnamed protein product [Caenorhabditis sp. 36 PRJEB53466]
MKTKITKKSLPSAREENEEEESEYSGETTSESSESEQEEELTDVSDSEEPRDEPNNFAISQTEFARLIKELEVPGLKMDVAGREALQTAAEDYMQKFLRSAAVVAASSGRTTVEVRDLKAVQKIEEEIYGNGQMDDEADSEKAEPETKRKRKKKRK